MLIPSVESTSPTTAQAVLELKAILSGGLRGRLMQIKKETLVEGLTLIFKDAFQDLSMKEATGSNNFAETSDRVTISKKVSSSKRKRRADRMDPDVSGAGGNESDSELSNGRRFTKRGSKKRRVSDAMASHHESEAMQMSKEIDASDVYADGVAPRIEPSSSRQNEARDSTRQVTSANTPAEPHSKAMSKVQSRKDILQSKDIFKKPQLPKSDRRQRIASKTQRKRDSFTPVPLDVNQQYGSIANPVSLLTPRPLRFEDFAIKQESRENSPTPIQCAVGDSAGQQSCFNRHEQRLARTDLVTPFHERLSGLYSAATTPSIINQGLEAFPDIRPDHSKSETPNLSPSNLQEAIKQDNQMFRTNQARTSNNPVRNSAAAAALRPRQFNDKNMAILDCDHGQGPDHERMQRPRHDFISHLPTSEPVVPILSQVRTNSQLRRPTKPWQETLGVRGSNVK